MRPIKSAFQPSNAPAVMAIVNRTPDSFYDKGATWGIDAALERVARSISVGASVIDIGGVKAGPGPEVGPAEEADRIIPLIRAVHEQFPQVTISVDTWRAEVAEVACKSGAGLINDTWAGADPELVAVAGQYQVGYVCSHTGGAQPRTRPFRVHFDDVMAEVIAETSQAAEHAVSLGVPENKILVDPTHDFGKNTFHGLELLRRLDELVAAGWPVLMALSNKDFVGETVGRGVSDRVPATLAATAYAAAKGVAMFRAHQVQETVDVCQMVAAIDGQVRPKSVTRGLQ